jgi:hypothetical protein
MDCLPPLALRRRSFRARGVAPEGPGPTATPLATEVGAIVMLARVASGLPTLFGAISSMSGGFVANRDGSRRNISISPTSVAERGDSARQLARRIERTST